MTYAAVHEADAADRGTGGAGGMREPCLAALVPAHLCAPVSVSV
jgi:hypothetical protein